MGGEVLQACVFGVIGLTFVYLAMFRYFSRHTLGWGIWIGIVLGCLFKYKSDIDNLSLIALTLLLCLVFSKIAEVDKCGKISKGDYKIIIGLLSIIICLTFLRSTGYLTLGWNRKYLWSSGLGIVCYGVYYICNRRYEKENIAWLCCFMLLGWNVEIIGMIVGIAYTILQFGCWVLKRTRYTREQCKEMYMQRIIWVVIAGIGLLPLILDSVGLGRIITRIY